MIDLDDQRIAHGGRLYEESSRGGEEKETVHFVLEESALGGFRDHHGSRDHHEGLEGGRGQSRIATTQMEEFEPTKRC